MLQKLSPLLGVENFGLCRDDGLAAVSTSSGPVLDRMRKNIISLFKEEGLSITTEINLVETDFLDVTFNLDTGKHFPFRNPNNNPIYTHAKSNHHSSIIKYLPNMVNKRLSDLSCNEEEFNKAKPLYENALKNSGFNTSIKYAKDEARTNRNRNRKIIWFNPPFSQSVKTNIGKTFIKLVKKHFPKHHKLSTIFNTNTLKLSYSCLKNMSSIIKQHNTKILSNSNNIQNRLCNCRNRNDCPLNVNCLKKCFVYKAEVTTDQSLKIYFGASQGEFKSRYNNHTLSFRNEHHANDTELSNHLW